MATHCSRYQGADDVIYLDYQATTPLAPEALEAMMTWLTTQGSANPHSSHVPGRAAKAAVELARDQVAALLPAGGRVFFTSGATEALNWALQGCRARRIATVVTEHAAVLDTVRWMGGRGHDVTLLPVDESGLVDLATIPADADLVCVMLTNNEIGTVQPVEQVARRAKNALILCDAVQGYGRLAIPQGCDMIAVSAHKIYGPKGVGALWVRDGVTLDPLIHGGGQEADWRSGTLSPALCAGFGVAATLAAARMAQDRLHVARLWGLATARLGEKWKINGSTEARWFGNLNIRRDELDAARLVSTLRDIAFSVGSACASGSGRPSHVLKAIGLTDAQVRSSIRLGFGRYTSEAELSEAVDCIILAADAQSRIEA